VTDGNLVRYAFNSDQRLEYANDAHDLVFHGKRGQIEFDTETGETTLTMLEGDRIGRGQHAVLEGEGPYTLRSHGDGVSGKVAGPERHLLLRQPPSVDRLAVLELGGTGYAPGTRGPWIIVPVMDGHDTFELKNIEQPPVFRNWQAWPERAFDAAINE